MTPRIQTTRRWLIGAAAIVAAAATAVRELPRFLPHHYRRTPYDDLLAQLPDRDAGVTFGRAAIKNAPSSADAIARRLRERLGKEQLESVSARELAEDRVVVAGGWVVPESLALMCALAARAS